MVMHLIVIDRIVARVEAWPSTKAGGLLVGLLVASYGILDGWNLAVAALVIAAKRHVVNGPDGCSKCCRQGRRKLSSCRD